ncbi:MAG: hypothetical protein AAF443_05300 [Chlamydiota bacterium]
MGTPSKLTNEAPRKIPSFFGSKLEQLYGAALHFVIQKTLNLYAALKGKIGQNRP